MHPGEIRNPASSIQHPACRGEALKERRLVSSMAKRYYDLNTYFRSLFGCRVQKITVDAGLSCPNRDGTLATGGCIYCNARGSGTGALSRGLSITEQLFEGLEKETW